MKLIKKIFAAIRYIFNRLEAAKRKAVDDGICDFSGQGRDRYGR